MFKRIISLFPLARQSPTTVGRNLARKINWIDVRPGQPTILAINRSQFSKDIEELRRRTELNWATISAVKIKKCQLDWVAKKDQQQTYFNGILRAIPAELRQRLIDFSVAFLSEASRKYPIDAVMAANVDYWQDEALKLACHSLNIPFLVLCRENYTVPWTLPWLHERFADANFRFEGAGVACFSAETKRAITPAVRNPEDIWVTGAPRYDRWLDLRSLSPDEKNHISLITFNLPGYGAQDVFKEVLCNFADAAKNNQDSKIHWLVKCKKRADLKAVGQLLPAQLRSKVSFSFDVPLFDLFPKSKLVIGYNSLALVEAILANAPVAIPFWGQARPEKSDLLLDPEDPLVQAVTHVAETPEALMAIMTRAAKGEDMRKGTPEQRRQIFTRHLHIPLSGHACSEVEKFARHYINLMRGS